MLSSTAVLPQPSAGAGAGSRRQATPVTGALCRVTKGAATPENQQKDFCSAYRNLEFSGWHSADVLATSIPVTAAPYHSSGVQFGTLERKAMPWKEQLCPKTGRRC